MGVQTTAHGPIAACHPVIIGPHNIIKMSLHRSACIANCLHSLKKCLIMISRKNSITATIEGNVIDIIYVGEGEIHRVLTYHYATYIDRHGPLLIVLYLILAVKLCTSLS